MEDTWRYTAKAISKYDPQFRNELGHYKKEEWTSFSQISDVAIRDRLTLDMYLQTEKKYCDAATFFFDFHKCDKIKILNLEKPAHFDYSFEDRNELFELYQQVEDGTVFPVSYIVKLVRLILRELMWAELHCVIDDKIAVRFGYDFYMYFNSEINIDELLKRIEILGLYVT